MIGLLTNIWDWVKQDKAQVFFFAVFLLWLLNILVRGVVSICDHLISPFRKQPVTIRVTAPQGMNTTELSRTISQEVQAVLRPQRRRTEPPQPDTRPSSLAVVMSDDED